MVCECRGPDRSPKCPLERAAGRTDGVIPLLPPARGGRGERGRLCLHKSRADWAYAQQLVTTRLLDCLHDPPPQLSRLQRIYPCALLNCNPPARSVDFDGAPVAGLLRYWAEAYSYPTTMCRRKSPLSGMDSDLEAFSHNPADGSFAALPGRTAAKTNYLNPRFLSY